MKKFMVFYRKALTFPFAPPVRAAYDEIAVIAAEDLECLFRVMNVVDGSGFEMPKKLGVRSMCVGDVAVDEAGNAHLCSEVGWNSVEFTG